MRVGDIFLGANGELSTLTNAVRVEQEGGIAVFNFTVEGNHNYFILAKEYEYGQSCVLVHNSTPCDGPGTSRPYVRKDTNNVVKRKIMGHYIDEVTGDVITNPVIGHKHGLEYWRLKEWAKERLTRKQWNNLNNRPEILQLEGKAPNAGHGRENKLPGTELVEGLLKKLLGNDFMKFL